MAKGVMGTPSFSSENGVYVQQRQTAPPFPHPQTEKQKQLRLTSLLSG